MDAKIYTKEHFVTSRWAGGTTTQLAIAPAGAIYAERDFLWRLSSAQVAQEYSVFTKLPDYNRLLGIIDGTLYLQTDTEPFFPLPAGQVWAFDGGENVMSQGLCRDFNLMLRKDACRGELHCLRLGGEAALPLTQPQQYSLRGVYCAEGLAEINGTPLGAQALWLIADAEPLHAKGAGLLFWFQVEGPDRAILQF